MSRQDDKSRDILSESSHGLKRVYSRNSPIQGSSSKTGKESDSCEPSTRTNRSRQSESNCTSRRKLFQKSKRTKIKQETGKVVESNDDNNEQRAYNCPSTTSASKKTADTYQSSNVETSQGMGLLSKEDLSPTHLQKPQLHLKKSNRTNFQLNSLWICQRKENHRKTIASWIFSTVTFLLCVVTPLGSFVADVSFFVACSEHFNDTKNLLDSAQENTEKISFMTFQTRTKNNSLNWTKENLKHAMEYRLPPAPLLSSRDKPGVKTVKEAFVLNEKHLINATNGQRKRDSAEKVSNISAFPHRTDPAPDSPIILRASALLEAMSQQCYTKEDEGTSVCNTVPEIRAFMQTKTAKFELEEHRHVTSDVFEPVFIIGSFPCLVLSIFTRLVIMITNHDHFMSAFVMNMASMPLQLITGALAVHSATYHVGPNGFECWRCAHEGNCSGVGALSFMEDHVTLNLIVATIAKFIDGIAGGCVLFLVLARGMWNFKQNNRLWYFSRVCILILTFLLCTTMSSAMVLTPSVGVFRLEMIEKMGHFPGKNRICYSSMALLAMGLTGWGLSLLLLVVYSSCKTYFFCRAKKQSALRNEV